MSSLFAPPELLSAYAMAEDGSGPALPFGTHLRIWSVPDKVDSCLGCEFKYVSVA